MSKKKRREWPPVGEPLPGPVMDNHTHLPVHDGEIPSPGGVKLSLEEQLERADAVGVARMITSACSLADWQPTLNMSAVHHQMRVALAIHPNEASLHAGFIEKSPDGLEHVLEDHHIPLDEALAQLEAQLSNPQVVAVGETGLDYFRTGDAGREAQKESFRAHIELARKYELPLQIHDREAHIDTIELLKMYASADQQIVFHCFSGDAQMARILAKHNWYASFAGPVTYPANKDLREALLALPRELVLVETDAPYLTPVPYRGCPNASYVMSHTVRYISELWQLPLEDACRQSMDNAVSVYGKW